jgi:exosortase family protein XrtF
MNWRDNLPAIKFLGIFLSTYLFGNLIYGFYIESNYPLADHVTQMVSRQSSWLINLTAIGQDTRSILSEIDPVLLMMENGKTILRVYEGCNGINVMIVFVAFLFAFDGISRHGIKFILVGILIIHAANLCRIILLFWVAKEHQSYFYYVHKYFFTAALYLIVMALWWVWVYRLLKKKNVPTR